MFRQTVTIQIVRTHENMKCSPSIVQWKSNFFMQCLNQIFEDIEEIPSNKVLKVEQERIWNELLAEDEVEVDNSLWEQTCSEIGNNTTIMEYA